MLLAAIEIGSTGIRLLVAEITENGERNILDRCDLPVSIGRDVFTQGIISRDTLLQCLSILNKYKEHLSGWGITASQTTAVATSAFREAKNQDSVLDRIMVKTGFRVKVIDGIEENRLMYLAVSDTLKTDNIEINKQSSIILEVGGGSSEIMLIENGKIAGAHSMRLGTVLIEQQLKSMMGSLTDAKRYVTEFINNTKGSLNNELNLKKIQQFLAIGADVKLAAIFAGTPISTFLWKIERNAFNDFVNEIQEYSVEEIVARFKISYNEAQSLHLSLLIYQLFVNLTDVQTIIVPETSLREGIIISKEQTSLTPQIPNSLKATNEFYEQIIASALNLLRKYHGDEKHAQYVRQICAKFFDSLKDELGLENDARLALELAAILHDIGNFIRADDHNQHSKYIIENSELFGVNKESLTMISQIALWHRGSKNMRDDPFFSSLPRKERLTVLKLTAILRISDSLDRAHTQRIKDFKITFTNDSMTIKTDGSHNNVLEKIAIAEKSDLFESVFGYKVILV